MIEIRLAELLEKRGKSQYWLANETGLKQQTIAKLFKRQSKKIDFETMNAICKAFECQLSEFLVYVKEEENKENSAKNKTRKSSTKS